MRQTRIGEREFHWGSRTFVMGILNVTPDSFSGDGITRVDRAISQARKFEEDGADLIDIGGESTRPETWSDAGLPASEELRRVVPVVEQVAAVVGIPVSIDTYKAEVAQQAVAAGGRVGIPLGSTELGAGGLSPAFTLPLPAAPSPYHVKRAHPARPLSRMEISTMAEQADAEFKLRDLNDQELTEQVHDDLYNGLKAEVEEATRIFLERGWNAEKVLNDALVEGMRIVGIDFRDGILFVPEVLLAANSMKGGMEILRPLLAETGVPPIGKIVIGTVKGDIHDIGKNLVSMMLEGAGFEVIDLGINNPVEKYLAALEQHKPDILGMSALLTTTMPYMKVVIDTLREKGIRKDYIVLVGGAPLNEEFGRAVGADAYCRDAAIAVETAKTLLAARRATRAA